ncbi:hypothetical protein NXH76_08975 [Blautia schinkii]|nr:hypothetical protein [Blautia schinkii]
MDIRKIAETVAGNTRGGRLVFSDETVGVSYIIKLFYHHMSGQTAFELAGVRHVMDGQIFRLSGNGILPDGTACSVEMAFSETPEQLLLVEMKDQYLLPVSGITLGCQCYREDEWWRVTFYAKESVSFAALLACSLSFLELPVSPEIFGDAGSVSNLQFTYELPYTETNLALMNPLEEDTFYNINTENYFSLYFETSLKMDLSGIFEGGNEVSLGVGSFLIEKFGNRCAFSFEGNLKIWSLEIPFVIRYDGSELRLSTAKDKRSSLRIPSVNELGRIVGINDLNLPQSLSSLTDFECESIELSVSGDFKQVLSFGVVVSNKNVWQLSQTPDIHITNITVGFTKITSDSSVFIAGDFQLDEWLLKLSAAYRTKTGWVFRCYLANTAENPLDLGQLFQKICAFLGFPAVAFPLPSLNFVGAMVSFDLGTRQFSALMEIGKLTCDFAFMATKSYHLELKSEYEISLANLPVAGKDMHLLDDVSIRDIHLVSANEGTVLRLQFAGKQLELRLAGKNPARMDITKEGTDSGLKLLWFQLEQSFSVFTIHRLGFGSDGKSITLAFDAGLAVSGFQVTAEGLAISVTLSEKLQLSFGLAGLCIAYGNPYLHVSGGFRHLNGPQGETYDGALSVDVKGISIVAAGSYSEGSFLAYGILRANIGGPPAFSITGLALGFGLNKYLQLPGITEVEEYPLVAAAMRPDFTIDRLLEGMRNKISAMPGQNFLAAGISFHSFGIAVSFALLTVSFGEHLEIGLLGLSELTVPPMTKKNPIAKATLALKAALLPEQGLFSVEAQLTKDSYILSRNCQLTGGFAFYMWFGGVYKGDFVITLGGYRDGYQKPEHYPDVPRLGFFWRVTPQLMMQGELYFALTPSMLCAGGKLEAVFQQGPLRAWFTAYADIEIGWKPFYYDFSVGVSLGASITLDFWLFSTTFTLEMSVDLKIRGPEFSGTARIKWWVISFTIAFGDQVQPEKNIGWDEFKHSFLNKPGGNGGDGDIVSIQAAEGQTGTITVTEQGLEKEIVVLHADCTRLTVESLIPETSTLVNGILWEEDRNSSLGVLPMGRVTLVSSLEIHVLTDTRDILSDCVTEKITQNVPKALWAKEKPKQWDGEEELIRDTLTGVSIRFPSKVFRCFPEDYFLTLDILSEYEKITKDFTETDVLVPEIKGIDSRFRVFRDTAEEITGKVGAFAREMEKEGFTFDFSPDLTMMAANAESLFEEEFFLA